MAKHQSHLTGEITVSWSSIRDPETNWVKIESLVANIV